MAPLRSFEVSRRIAVSIDLDRTAARAWTKSFAPYFGVVAAVAPSLCMCLKGYCSPSVTPLVELLLGALRAFRPPIPLNVPGPLPSRRTAGERSFPSIPSFPWSTEDKLIPVVLEHCYVPFTSSKVVLFLGLFSPFHFHRFLNLFGMCELHLRTFAVAGDHGRKFFFLGVSSAFRQQVQRLGPRCTSDRLHRELVGASLSEPHTDVLAWDSVTRDIYVNNIHRARVNIGWYLASAIWPEVRPVDRVYIFAEPQARQISTRSTVRTEGHITS